MPAMHVITTTARAVLASLRFWVVNLPTLLRLTWFPLFLLGVVSYGWFYWNTSVDNWNVQHPSQPRETILPFYASIEGTLLWLAIHLVVLSSCATAVHRFCVNGESRPGAYFSFSFGRAEAWYADASVIGYLLMCLLLLGQYVTQFEWPQIDESLVTTVMKTHADLGPWSLSMFLFPGEIPAFTQPLPNYAVWISLVITALAVLLLLAPWMSIVASEGRLALADSVELTSRAPGTVVLFGVFVGLALVLLLVVLSVTGLGFLAANSAAFDQLIQSIFSPSGATAADPVTSGHMTELGIALGQEIYRFVSHLLGVTLGAVLTSGLYLHLRENVEA